jgi:hypothetical protein
MATCCKYDMVKGHNGLTWMIVGAYGNLKQKSVLAIRQIVDYVKNTTVLYNYWHFVMATCFGPPLDHLQANVFK